MEYTGNLAGAGRTKINYPYRKVGILGGTFNPPHNGHVDMAQQVKMEFALEDVYLMPCGTPPHKSDDLASTQMRLKMTELCIAGEDGLKILDIETKRKGYTYTADTMRALKKKNPE
ncbi:MAG: adenylyltransferase/cytidyltransferase family protein, partial [Christensenella sp.]|uniref:nicotinate-nicotinamide nucleotide adenylyltransferase n=1 Tax=Christensenella sp. TaxID=1935934 RepID=UPI002B20DE10